MKNKKQIKLHKSVIEVIDSATELVNSMIELHKLKQKPIPDYSKGNVNKLGLALISSMKGKNYKETIVLPDGKKVHVPNYKQNDTSLNVSETKIDNETNYFIMDELGRKIEIDKPFNFDSLGSDFNKQMLEADKELQKVYKEFRSLKALGYMIKTYK